MTGRGTETPETLKTRVGNAEKEMQTLLEKTETFQYRVTNDKLDEAVMVLDNILGALYAEKELQK